VRSRRTEAAVARTTLLVTAAAWLLVAGRLVSPAAEGMHAHGHGLAGAHGPAILSGLVDWGLMLLAMMTPVVAAPLAHLVDRSFATRRLTLLILFVTGYGATWTGVGIVLLAVAAALDTWGHRVAIVGIGIAVALTWQCSPAKQRCLNRCHVWPPLPAFGLDASLAAARFGAVHGWWCAGSCWPVMLVPLLLSSGHLVAMAAGTLLIVGERLEHPASPAWRWRGPSRAYRFARARAWPATESGAGWVRASIARRSGSRPGGHRGTRGTGRG
jgi:hypothetical protein